MVTTTIFTVPGDVQDAAGNPTGYDLNHLQSQLRASAILLGPGLPGLLPFPFSPATWCQLVLLPFAIEPHQDGNGPVLLWSKGQSRRAGRRPPSCDQRKRKAWRAWTRSGSWCMSAPQMWRPDLRAKVSSTAPSRAGEQKGNSKSNTQCPNSSRSQRAWLKKR